MSKTVIRFGVCVLPMLGLACGAESLDRSASGSDPSGANPSEPSSTISDPAMDRINALDQDLSLGATGDDVIAVHAYLSRYGYFPNEGIMRQHPAWRPLVAEAPASPSIFDERTIEAVKKFQSNYGIPVSGIVDTDTRAMMRMPRCGNPDGITHEDPSDKYAILGKYWGNTAKWLFKTPISGDPNMLSRVNNATHTWWGATTFSFSQITTGTYDISITWTRLPCYPWACDQTAWAVASKPDFINNTADITVNSSKRWWYGTGNPPNDGLTGDFQSVILHELGHAIGLDHSSVPGAVMYPGIAPGQTKRILTVDDQVGVSSLYDQWQQMDDATLDVGVGANGDVWAISSSDQSVWKLEGGSWYWTGGIASRIAVAPNGWPYVVAGNGTIWGRNSNSKDNGPPPGSINPPAWTELPGGGCARDLGLGVDWGLWVIGCGSSADTTIWKFNGSGWTPDQSGGLAQNIAVGDDGRPWVATSSGSVWHYTTNDPMTGHFELISTSPAARDIGVGPGLYPWIVDTSPGTAYVLDWQQAIGSGNNGAPGRNEWRALPSIGRGYRIAVGPIGEPWVANTVGKLYHMVK